MLPMDADEIAHISATLIGAVAEARAYAKTSGIDDEFREILRYAGEMHDVLIETLIENEPLSTEYLRGVAVSTATRLRNSRHLRTCRTERWNSRSSPASRSPAA